MKILIDYSLHTGDKQTIELTPEAYFDLEPGEEATLKSVPRHDHAVEYLPVALSQVRMTRLQLLNEAVGTRRSITESFWNDGKNRVIERLDSGPVPYWEMIFDSLVSEEPKVREILRLVRQDDALTPVYHGFFQSNTDGSRTETKIFPPASRQE